MLEIDAMGLKLKNPIIVSAGPWTRGHEKVRLALESGAAAVTTESIVGEPYPDMSPRYAYDGNGLQNIRMYSGLDMEGWLREFEILEKNHRFGMDGLIIANIMANSASELAYLARKFEKAGADAIELGIACPMGEGQEIIAGNPEKVYDYTKAVVDVVNVPVIVKLTQSMFNLSEVVSAITKAGASGISGIDTMKCILNIDIETGKPVLPTYGGYSGGPIRPMGLAIVAGAAQSTDIPIIGIGGIENYHHAIEYIMAGASLCGIGTSVMINGYGIIKEILDDMNAWLEEHDIKNVKDISGVSLKELYSFEELKVEPNKAYLREPCTRHECKKCIPCCLDNSVSYDAEGISVDHESCTGCGLCIEICPHNILELKWE